MSILRREHIINIIGTRAFALLTLCCLLSCETSDTTEPPSSQGDKVAVNLALCVSPAQDQSSDAVTRQSSEVVQQGQNQIAYRGITDIRLIPFSKHGILSKEDDKDLVRMSGIFGSFEAKNYSESNPSDVNLINYLTENVELTIGTGSFLAYAKANELEKESGLSDADWAKVKDFKNGKIVTTTNFSNDNITPADIVFTLSPIYESSAPDALANKLASYLTGIARTLGTYTSKHNTLKTLYDGFTGGGVNALAGSSANIEAMVTKLYKDLTAETWTHDEKGAIISAIATAITTMSVDDVADINETEKTVTLRSVLQGYPANINLPDGSAAMKWNTVLKPKEGGEEGEMEEDLSESGSSFIALTSSDNGLDMNDMSRYCYPAELYYCANSGIRTSTSSQSTHYTENSWTTILSNYDPVTPNSDVNRVVASTTRSVALEEQLDYGVSCAELTIIAVGEEETGTGTYYLHDGNQETEKIKKISVDALANEFTLTGVFFGGQFPVDFDFEPNDATSGEDLNLEQIVYDKFVTSDVKLTATESAPNYTLVFQTKKNKPINIVLEFENNWEEFYGHDGIIYPGTRFYLSGKILPASEGDDKNQRAFKKDHKSVLLVKVNSLKNAYNVIPDLKTAQYDLEVTSVAVRQWNEDNSKSHTVYNW